MIPDGVILVGAMFTAVPLTVWVMSKLSRPHGAVLKDLLEGSHD